MTIKCKDCIKQDECPPEKNAADCKDFIGENKMTIFEELKEKYCNTHCKSPDGGCRTKQQKFEGCLQTKFIGEAREKLRAEIRLLRKNPDSKAYSYPKYMRKAYKQALNDVLELI